MTDIDPIIRWKFTADETAVYRIAKMWEEEVDKLFPGNEYAHLPKKSDPRKGTLFKVCWQLYRETRDQLKFSEYPFYIHANLFVIKKHNGFIGPNVICGERAMIRYKLWKSWYKDEVRTKPTDEGLDPKIVAELEKTKKFLFERCGGQPTAKKLEEFANSGELQVWVGAGLVSKNYAALSPILEKLEVLPKLEFACMFSAKLVRDLLSQEIKWHFRQEFHYEFK